MNPGRLIREMTRTVTSQRWMRILTNQGWMRVLTITLGLGAIVIVTLLKQYYPKAFEWAELKASDLRIYRGTLHKPTGNVVIARIDDKSIAELGRFPWPRSVEARLVDALRAYQVAVIGFDVAFSERDPSDALQAQLEQRLERAGIAQALVTDALGGDSDMRFAQAMDQQGSTYLGYFFQSHMFHHATGTELTSFRTKLMEPAPVAYNMTFKSPGARQQTYLAEGYLPPVPILNRAARGTAYVDIDEDSDGTARVDPTVISFDGRYCVPLFLAMADAYFGHPPLILRFDADGVSGVEIGTEQIPVNERGDMLVRFRGPPGTMPHVSIADIIFHRLPAGALAHKAVIVGVTAHAIGDRVVAPVSGDFPGVEFQGSAVDNVLAGDFIYNSLYLSALERASAWLLGAAATLAAAFMTALASLLVVLALGAGFLGYTQWELAVSGRLVGVVFPIITLLATYFTVVSYRYFAEGREKRFIRLVLERYVHPAYVATVMKQPSMLKLGGERTHLSILFADIMGFTSRAELSEPEPLVELLNTYMTVMTDVIFAHQGVVDKLMGDGIMAFWGAPLKVTNPARDAIDCAIAMIRALNHLAVRDDRFHDIHIGVGIATGYPIVGNFGGEKKFDYSAIGDVVNLASRLEGLTREFKVNILVNQQTYDEASGDYIARQVGLVRVKGKNELVPVVEVAGDKNDRIDPAHYQRFSDAMALLQQGQSPEEALLVLQREWPHDHVITKCLELLHSTDGGPLPAEMVFRFDTK